MSDMQQVVTSSTANVTYVEGKVFDPNWKSCKDEFPKFHDADWEGGHEVRSDIVWLYQPAHESKNHSDDTTTVWPSHVYLGMCIRPLIRTPEGYDYGDPYFIDIGRRSICAVTMWKNLEAPMYPYDPLEAKGRADGTFFNPECHKGNIVRDEGTPSNFL